MYSEYIVNGEVARLKIAMDIKNRKLDKVKIEKLCEDQDISSAFRGSMYLDKRPKSEWNKDYLGQLSYAVIAESFNRDYLLYLNEVAAYLLKVKYKKLLASGTLVALVFLLGVIFYKYIFSGA